MSIAATNEPAVVPPGDRSPGWIRTQGMLQKEIRGRMRGPGAFVILSIYLLLLAGFVLLVYFFAKLTIQSNPTTSAGKVVFLTLAAIQLSFVCFLAPSFTAGAISGERERQTYDLLLTTPLPLPLIIGAKLLASLSYVFLLIFAALPLMSVALFLGGVALEEVLITLVLLCASALLFGMVGLCCSAWLRSTIGAAVLAYGAMLLPVVIFPIVLGTIASTMSIFLSSSSPVSTATQVSLYYIGGFLSSLNPFIAGGLTEALLINNKSLFFGTIPGPANSTVLYVGPWLIYTVLAILASVGLYFLTIVLARPTRRQRRSQAA